MFTALGLEWREPKDRDGVQVEAVYNRGAGGAVELSGGRVVPVPSNLEQQQQQQQRAFLQQQRFPAAEVMYRYSSCNSSGFRALALIKMRVIKCKWYLHVVNVDGSCSGASKCHFFRWSPRHRGCVL